MVKLPKFIANIKFPKVPGGIRYKTVGEYAKKAPKDIPKHYIKQTGRATRAISGDYSGVQEQVEEMGTGTSKAAKDLTGSTSKKEK